MKPDTRNRTKIIAPKSRRTKIWTRWNDMLLRSKEGNNMKENPLDIICAVQKFSNVIIYVVQGLNHTAFIFV